MHKTSFRVGLASIVTRLGDTKFNVARIERAIKQLKTSASNCDAILFPEACITGGFPAGDVAEKRKILDKIAQLASPSFHEQFIDLASRYATPFCAGFVERDDGDLFITHCVWAPDGVLCSQRKLFATNPRRLGLFSEGRVLNPFTLKGKRCAILACADWLLPETTILTSLHSLGLVLAPTDCFDANRQSRLEALMRSKVTHTDAAILAVFASNCEHDSTRTMAALALDREGRVLVSDTKFSTEDRLICLDIQVHEPRIDTWGGCAERLPSFMEKLQTIRDT